MSANQHGRKLVRRQHFAVRLVLIGVALALGGETHSQHNREGNYPLSGHHLAKKISGTHAGNALASTRLVGETGSFFRGGELSIREGKQPHVMLGHPIRFSAEFSITTAIHQGKEPVRFDLDQHAVIVNESTGKVCWEQTSSTYSMTGPGNGRGMGIGGRGPVSEPDRRPLCWPCRFDVGDFTFICFVVGQIGEEPPVLLGYERTTIRVEENDERQAVLQQLNEVAAQNERNHGDAIQELLYYVSLDDDVAERIANLDLRPKSLDLTNARLAKAGVLALSRIPGLRWVRLRGSSVDDSCLDALLSMKDLEFIDLRGTLLSEESVETLHEAFPKLKILVDAG